MDVEAMQLFPARPDQPWRPSVRRPDPYREARDFLFRLCTLGELPPREVWEKELRLVGGILTGGSRALHELPPSCVQSIRTFPLRVLFQATQELVKDGEHDTFTHSDLTREIARWGGVGYDEDYVRHWCEAAVRRAQGGHHE